MKPSPITAGQPRRAWIADLAILLLLSGLWWIWLQADVTRMWPVGFDTFRDAAAAENVLAGRWLRDPSIAGQTFWYAPLGPMFFAAVSYLTDTPPLVLYSSSILWLNVLLPIGWYLLVRLCCDRRTAIVGVLLVWLGSRWWSASLAIPMTSIHGVMLLTAVFIAWLISLRSSRRTALAVGVLLAMCTWVHIVSGVIASGVIGLHALLGAQIGGSAGGEPARVRRAEGIKRMLIVAGVCAPLIAPLAWHLLRLPRVNPAPLEYTARELRDPAFAVQAATPLVLVLAVIGLLAGWRRMRQPVALCLAYAVVGLVGQLLGYARLLTDMPVPALIPHEFQWNFQIAVGLLAALGTACSAAWLASYRGFGGRLRVRSRLLAMLVLVGIAVGTDLLPALDRKSEYWWPTRALTQTSSAEVSVWIKTHTSIDDVFLAPAPYNYMLIGGGTGRKLVAPPEGHAHISVDAEQRVDDAERMFATHDPLVLRGLLRKYDVRYVLLPYEHKPLWERWQAWGVLEPVFRNSSGMMSVLRVVSDEPPAHGPPETDARRE